MFEGFSPEAFDFLWGIRFNNNKAWFEEHKATYLERLYEPMKQLAREVFEPLSAAPGLLCKVSRIYRDARLPRYAERPYKDSLWFCIRGECASWSEHPALFFEIAPEGCTYGFGLVHPKADAMNAFRAELAANPAPFLEIVEKIERQTDVTVGGEAYYRKKPCPAPDVERFYNLKNVSAWREVAPGDALFTPALSGEVRALLGSLMPLYTFFHRLTG